MSVSSKKLCVQQYKCVLAVAQLNQWALDFDGNLDRVMESIRQAKAQGARYRLGPELELSGYGCEDHFLESDTFMHCEQSLASVLSSGITNDIICDIGCPMTHNGVRYNCRVYCLNGRILFIRPKLVLANDGNYRELRYFSSWTARREIQDHLLSPLLVEAIGTGAALSQQPLEAPILSVPFGDAILQTSDTLLGSEICEELWSPMSSHTEMALAGVEIFTNGSGSHHSLYKLDTRFELIQSAMRKCGGVYLYANHRGCDSGRLYFDGSSLICCNGNPCGNSNAAFGKSSSCSQASQFSLRDVEVVTSCVDLEDVRRLRMTQHSYQEQNSLLARTAASGTIGCDTVRKSSFPIVSIREFALCSQCEVASRRSSPLDGSNLCFSTARPEEECLEGPACWLWDYLRRSGAKGFLLPLSGGADSASVATIVYTMCTRAVVECKAGNVQVRRDIERLLGRSLTEADVDRLKVEELCSEVLHTVYLGTNNSSRLTASRAERLASDVSSYHIECNVNSVVEAVVAAFSQVCPSHKPQFQVHGGSATEDLALQNIQARVRMVMSYLFAQLLPWVRSALGQGMGMKNSSAGFLLVLGSSNVDEGLRGYMTKYDCSSADINPIGSISKTDLKKMLLFASERYGSAVMKEIATAAPSAELRPISDAGENGDNPDRSTEIQGYTQTDEEDMGMTYSELGAYGYLRKVVLCGPVSMFLKLLEIWTHLTPAVIAAKVKHFFRYYGINRHKMTTLTPSYHAERYSPDDNRFDLRPFLYNIGWTRQFNSMDAIVEGLEQEGKP